MIHSCLFSVSDVRNVCMYVCMYIAGHYVPATAQVIVESNSVYSKNLKGIGIGNGWVDPVIQYQAYAQVSGCGSGWRLGMWLGQNIDLLETFKDFIASFECDCIMTSHLEDSKSEAVVTH